MKWTVLRLIGDSEAQATTFLAIPEDLCYVSLGLVLGDFANESGSFGKYFKGSSHITVDIFVVALINVIVAIAIHILAKLANDNFKSWRAAGAVRFKNSGANSTQMELGLSNADGNIERIQIRHMAVFTLSYFLQVTIVIRWLSWIAQVMGN
jgi:hypothetical protein